MKEHLLSRSRLFRLFPAICCVMMTFSAVAVAFSPAREFPDTHDRISVFVDQLSGGLSTAQKQFAATHYVGTQKQTSNLIDAIRVYNPDFIMLQYRLGVRESDVVFIHNDTWSSDWATVTSHEDWFIHDNQSNRVYQNYGSVKEYCMDVSGTINGNTTAGWKEYWSNTAMADATASHADGVFADSTHLPYAVPMDLWDSPIGNPPHTPYIPHMEAFYDYTYQRFNAANQYFIPNIGGLTTTLDTTTGYYEDVHGAMVEGFGTKASNFDWKLQQNRTLNLIRNGKIYIAQNGVSDRTDIAGRIWYLSNFLLLKGDRSYVNVLGAGSQMYWWPEYDLDLGAPVSPAVPADIANLMDPGGVYVREFERGLVLVNPTAGSLTYTFAPDDPLLLVVPFGGGNVLPDGSIEYPGGWDLVPQGGSITLAAWSGAILLGTGTAQPVAEPAGLVWFAGAVSALLLRRRR